jgi:hypothetical protein
MLFPMIHVAESILPGYVQGEELCNYNSSDKCTEVKDV